MRITLMHNPTAGRGEHARQELVSALAKAGHQVTYQSTKKSSYKKALKKPADLVLVAGGDGTVGGSGNKNKRMAFHGPLNKRQSARVSLGHCSGMRNAIHGQ